MSQVHFKIRPSSLKATRTAKRVTHSIHTSDRHRSHFTRVNSPQKVYSLSSGVDVALEGGQAKRLEEREVFTIEGTASLRSRLKKAIHQDRLDDAQKCLFEAEDASIVDYNNFMILCLRKERPERCKQCFNELQRRGSIPDKTTFHIMMNCCIKEADLVQGLELINLFDTYGLTMDFKLYSLQIELYIACDRKSEALSVLDEMEKNGMKPALDTYNLILGGFSQSLTNLEAQDSLKKAQGLFEEMRSKGIQPDARTYVIMCQVALAAGSLELIKKYKKAIKSTDLALTESDCFPFIYAVARRQQTRESDPTVSLCWNLVTYMRNGGVTLTEMTLNALTKLYASLHCWDLVFGVWNYFESIHILPMQTTYNILVQQAAFKKGNIIDENLANSFIDLIDKSHVPKSRFMYDRLIKLMANHNHVNGALDYLKEMRKRRFYPKTKHYNICINLLTRRHSPLSEPKAKRICLALLKEMKEDSIAPDEFTYCATLKSAINTFDWTVFYEVLEMMMNNCHDLSLKAYNIILNGFSKQGKSEIRSDLAWEYFEKLKTSGNKPSVVSYTTMMNVCIRAEDFERGIDLFNEMTANHIEPTSLTYTTLIHLAGQIGDSNLVFELFDEIKSKGFHKNKIMFACLIGACGKANRFDKALEYFEEMKTVFGRVDSKDYESLIHAAGFCKRIDWVLEYFNEVKTKFKKASCSVYNCTLKSLIDCEALNEAKVLMEEMKQEGCSVKTSSAKSLMDSNLATES
eukprot:g8513.t1